MEKRSIAGEFSFVSHEQSPVIAEPGNCSFDYPAMAIPSTIIIDGDEERGEYLCPCCSHKLLIVKEKGRKP